MIEYDIRTASMCMNDVENQIQVEIEDHSEKLQIAKKEANINNL